MNVFIDLNKVRQPKVKKFIQTNQLNSPEGFDLFSPVCFIQEEESTYRKHHRTFTVPLPIEQVWKAYITIHPRDAWHGTMVSFGLQFSRRKRTVSYLNDPYSELERGQIIILNLNILAGILNIAVAHEVAEVNHNEKLIKLCYMAGGASVGSQWIRFNETQEGQTEISHLTLYKSNSRFRDTILYPALHTKAISEFHHSVWKSLGL